MKSYDEMAKSVLLRKDEYIKNKKLKTKKRITAFCTCLCLIGALVAVQAVWLNFNLVDGGGNINPQVSAEDSENYISDPKAQGELSNGDKPYSTDITIEGNEITDAEVADYLKENISDIKSLLDMTDKPTFLGGYCHITYNDNSFKLRQGYRDYLIYSDDKLIGIITIYKEKEEMQYTLSCEANWFEKYETYLEAHKGEKLLYFYIGMQEVIISPDSTYFNPIGYDVSNYFENITEPYKQLYNDKAIFIP